MPQVFLAQRIRIEVNIPNTDPDRTEENADKIVQAMEDLDLQQLVKNWLSERYSGEFRVTVTGQ